MAKRRAKGEGTIYQRPDGLWAAQITLPDGQRKTKYNKKQKVVKEWLLDARRSIQTGVWVVDDQTTVSEYFDSWYEDTISHTLKPKTLDSYKSIIDLHILPNLGYLKLIHLRPDHLQSLYSSKIKDGYSNQTVRHIHAVIHRALDQALKWGMVYRNVSDLVDAPRPVTKAPKTFTVEQVRIFLDNVKEDRLYALYVLAFSTGMRRGEILGLDWEDVNFDAGVLNVRRTLQYISGTGIVIGEPKSEKSRRSIKLPQLAIDALEEHYEKSTKTGFVFQTSNATPFSPRNIIRHFKSILKKTNLPIDLRFHDMRHTAATLHLVAGTSPKVVQELLGHSQISVTMDIYSHVMPTLQQEAAENMNTILSGS